MLNSTLAMPVRRLLPVLRHRIGGYLTRWAPYLAILFFVLAVYPYRINFVPAFFYLLPWDEVSYIWQAHRLVQGEPVPYSAFPLVSLFYTPIYLAVSLHPSWLVLADWIGRILLFGLLLLTNLLIARRVRDLVHPWIFLSCLMASAILPTLLGNASDSLYCILSGLAFWQLLTYAYQPRIRHLTIASFCLGLAALARNDGLVMAPLLAGLGLLITYAHLPASARRLKRAVVPLLASLVPVSAIIGGYILLFGLITGHFHTGTNIRSYFTFEYAQGWVYLDRYGSGGEAYLAGFAEARRLYGTPGENNHSVLRAILRNPTAFAARVLHLVPQVPGLASASYGGLVGGAVLIFALVGIAALLRRRLFLPLAITLVWVVQSATYLAFSFSRPGYILLSFVAVLLLAAVGLSTVAGLLISRGYQLAALIGLPLVGAALLLGRGFDVGTLSLIALLMTVLIIRWLASIKHDRAAIAALGALVLTVAIGYQTAYPVPPGLVLGETGEEKAALFLRQQLGERAIVVSSTPAIPWLAGIAWTEQQFELSQLRTDAEFETWLKARNIDAIYLDYWLRAFVPTFYALAEQQIGRQLIEAYSVRDERPERQWYRSLAMPPGVPLDETFRVLIVKKDG